MKTLQYSVVMIRELPKKANLSIFNTGFVPDFTYGHKSWEITKRVQSQVQAFEMGFL